MKRILFRLVVPAVLGMALGVLALAYAMQNEPSISPLLLAVFSPGLKVAELVIPARRQSLGTTFGDFLRVAIGVNVVFYFLIFAFFGYIASRRSSRASA
jgi:hypothetical protein